jgi:S1-C subfamily serine protease
MPGIPRKLSRATHARRTVRFAALAALSLCAASPALAQKVMSVAELVRTVKPAVVYIATFDAKGEQEGLGSGFVVDSGGVIVTNLHVIKGARALAVKMADGEVYDKVEILDYDARRDIAVLKVRAFGKLPTVPLGDSDTVEIGEEAVAVGNPKGMEHTVTSGLVSAFRQDEGYKLIQISVPISPGSSGGPLFDRQGRVIGITTAQLRGEGVQNLNFAVPINYVKPLIDPRATPITIEALNAKIGATPTSSSPSAPAPGGRNAADSGDEGWWAAMAHDHVNGDFTDFCVGQLFVKAGRIGYVTRSGMHNFEVPVGAIKEAKRNLLTGVQYQAFHITLKTGTNYNLAALNDNGLPVSPDEVIYMIMQAMARAR